MKKKLMKAEEPDFTDDDAIEGHIDSVMGFMRETQKTALELTELVLKHCTIDNLNEERVFQIFTEAVSVVSEPFNR